MDGILHVLLISIYLRYTASTSAGPPSSLPCCPQKTVGGVSYTLVQEADTRGYNCLANCTYQQNGNPSQLFCFTSGDLEVVCGGIQNNEELISSNQPGFQKVAWGFNGMQTGVGELIRDISLKDLMARAEGDYSVVAVTYQSSLSFGQLFYSIKGTTSPADLSWNLYIRQSLMEQGWLDSSSVGTQVDINRGNCRYPDEQRIYQKQRFNILPVLRRTYTVLFEVRIATYGEPVTQLQSVIHFTIGQLGNYGDRTPAVWIRNRKFFISSAINGEADYGINIPYEIPLQEWINVEISQQLLGSKIWFNIKINGEAVWSVENSQPRDFANVNAYAGDENYPPADGYIRKICVET